MNKDVERWARVSVDAVFSGREAQARNMLKMALQDIGRLGADLAASRAELKDMELRETLLQKSLINAREDIGRLGTELANTRQEIVNLAVNHNDLWQDAERCRKALSELMNQPREHRGKWVKFTEPSVVKSTKKGPRRHPG
jgi:chromosome segregation ATPase